MRSSAENSRPVPVTRTSVAWAGVWAAALVSVAFIVFMLQNTTVTQVSFLGLHGTLPLAVAMLIAMISGILLTLVLGTARITQLRRLASRRRRQNR
ncbi:lipopolysaccharide assembly protein LapA domain-containing protein [Nonomuraea solani]|uniref:lipopolysaccharide assembly protein LapA domain-containing protein n=1 Tax=Nonomuraea solani TaxID=1144553 RepID=UPI00135A5F9A|nr:lipopolysaccharide assembly protein LapA domain-containing protein [Nonomuraea solani]